MMEPSQLSGNPKLGGRSPLITSQVSIESRTILFSKDMQGTLLDLIRRQADGVPQVRFLRITGVSRWIRN
jgi:hypothetical protein